MCDQGTLWGGDPKLLGASGFGPAAPGPSLGGDGPCWRGQAPPHQPPPLPEWREETKVTCAKQAHSDEWAAESAY